MKHGNKYWENEKEYISLILERDRIMMSTGLRWRELQAHNRVSEIDKKLHQKFYNKYSGRYNTAPKWYREMLNKSQRAKSKQTLYRELQGYEVCYEDNYKGCYW